VPNGFTYSEALKDKQGASVPDPEGRADIISCLRSLSPNLQPLPGQ
jgi:hypothetical protein